MIFDVCNRFAFQTRTHTMTMWILYTVNAAEHLARPFKAMIMFFKCTNILQFSTLDVDSVELLSRPSCLVPLTRVKLTRTTMYVHAVQCTYVRLCATRYGCWFSIEWFWWIEYSFVRKSLSVARILGCIFRCSYETNTVVIIATQSNPNKDTEVAQLQWWWWL